MIVTFRTNPSGVGTVDTGYVNFLRCVTAILTANAGTTSLTVNPYTANNTINTGFNCIVSIDSNLEAGGWLTSASHHVPSSANNVAASIQSISTVAAFTYKADFYKATTGKASQPYYKLCFHSYNDYTTTGDWAFSEGGVSTLRFAKSGISATAGANMLITYGSSSTTDWTSTTFPPAGGSTSLHWNKDVQTTSFTMNGDMFSANYNNGPGLYFLDTAIQYTMAVGADYCLIWENRINSTFTTGAFHTTTAGTVTSTNWNQGRYGSMFYMGTRETQPWEDSRSDNPPWVAWNILVNNFASAAVVANPTSQTLAWSNDGVCAYMASMTAAGIVNAPKRRFTVNTRTAPRFYFGDSAVTGAASTLGPGTLAGSKMNLDSPIFKLKNWGTSSSYDSGFYFNANSDNFNYMPQVDPISGTLVPGAYPIMIQSSHVAEWTPGGKCRGIYKSLGCGWTQMRNYWQAPNQTFKIDGVDYLPVVIYEDMWLIRVV